MVAAKKIQEMIQSIGHSLDDPEYYRAVFEKIARAEGAEQAEPLQKLFWGEAITLSADLERTLIQESWSWRNVFQARGLAQTVIDDQGHLRRNELLEAIHLLEANLYSLGPHRHHDAVRLRHQLRILRQFHEEETFVRELNRIGKPMGNVLADKLIRATLFLPEKEKITDAQARRAALCGLLTYLRQNIGSCFATAPAILIQTEQPLQFLSDIGQLLGSGRLTRVVEGEEYAVPLSASWGVGDLFRPFFLWNFGKNPWKTLSSSPGLLAAFEAAGAIDKKEKKVQRVKQCQSLLQSTDFSNDPFTPLTPDLLIRSVLHNFFKVNEESVEQYKSRPREGIFGGLMASQPAIAGKSLAAHRFLHGYELAKEAFKAMTDNALLKAWEFSLASLSESKAVFARWNLFSSLGLHPEEPDGIGQMLHQKLQEKVDKLNEEIEEHTSRYDHLYAQAKYLEGRINRASTDSELGWLRADYQLRRHELNRVICERDEAHERGRKMTNLFPFLIQFYSTKFREYFQEVYDAEMRDISLNPYDDTSAGFRLLYKHGRTSTALWTLIDSPAEYIQSLASFFIATETELARAHEVETLQREFSDLVTAIITHIKRPEFLESSFHRLAQAYREPPIQDPLNHLDKIQRKPWSYTSGGTMETLVSCYYGRAEKPKEASQWVESETELLAFLLDTLKEMPLSEQNQFKEKPYRSILAFSPTHAFLCKPGWKMFQKGWDNDLYTFSWIRDRWARSQEKFLAEQLLDTRKMDFLASQFVRFIPEGYRPIYRRALGTFSYSMTPPDLRNHVLKTLSYEKWLSPAQLKLLSEEIDSYLFSALPLFSEQQLRENLRSLFDQIEEIEPEVQEKLLGRFDHLAETIGRYKILTAQNLCQIAKTLLILVLGKTRSPIPYHQKITEVMQSSGLGYPAPMLFADTNWVKNCFGFIISPGSEKLEFWRFDNAGSEGRPITAWKRYLDGTVRQPWGLYTAPSEYQA